MTEAGEPKSRYYLMIYYFSIGALLVYIVSCIWGKNYLYADGAGYFYNMLANDNFQLWPDGRIFSQILMQFFSVNAMNIGVTSVRVIGALFGFGATFWTGLFYVLSMHLCLKRNRPEYMAMISMMLCLLLAFTGFFTQIESSVTVAVFCYMFFHFLLYDEKKFEASIFEKIGMMAVALLCIKINEYFLIFGFVLLLVLAYKLVLGQIKFSNYWLAHIIIQIVILMSSYAGTQVKDSSGLMSSLRLFWNHVDFIVIFVLFSASVLLAAANENREKCLKIPVFKYIFKDTTPGKRYYVIEGLFAAAFLFDVIFRADLVAQNSFELRIINLAVPLLMSIAVLLIDNYRIRVPRLPVCSFSLIAGFAVFAILSSYGYQQYINRVYSYCEKNTGFVTIGKSNINESGYCWGWPVQMESVDIQMIRGHNEISCIIIQDHNIYGYEPFETDNIDAYARFEKYGVVYKGLPSTY